LIWTKDQGDEVSIIRAPKIPTRQLAKEEGNLIKIVRQKKQDEVRREKKGKKVPRKVAEGVQARKEPRKTQTQEAKGLA